MLFDKNYFKSLILVGLLSNQAVLAHPRLIKQALALYDQASYQDAQVLIDQASEDKKLQTQASTWYYRGVIYEQLMRKNVTLDVASQYLEEALQAYQQTLNLAAPQVNQYHSFTQLNKQGLWVYYLYRGIRYYKAEAFDQALEAFAICKGIQPNEPYALLYTAITAHQQGQPDLALAQYEAYLQVSKGAPPVYRGLANLIANHLEDPLHAHEILLQGLSYYPWEVILLEEQHQVLGRLNQLTVRDQQLKAQITTVPTDALPYFQLGYLYEQLDRLAEACAYYQQAVYLAPQQLAPICRLGIVYYNQAANIINAAVEMSEEDFQKIGGSLQAQGDKYLKKALRCFKQARKLKRSNLFIIKQLHIIYTRLHMPAKVLVIENAMKRMRGGAALLASMH